MELAKLCARFERAWKTVKNSMLLPRFQKHSRLYSKLNISRDCKLKYCWYWVIIYWKSNASNCFLWEIHCVRKTNVSGFLHIAWLQSAKWTRAMNFTLAQLTVKLRKPTAYLFDNAFLPADMKPSLIPCVSAISAHFSVLSSRPNR